MRIARGHIAALILGLLILSFVPPVSGQLSLTVAINENRPLAYFDENGDPAGFYVDLLDHIAAQENWTLEYVELPRAEVFELADAGEIDIIATIGYHELFIDRYVFVQEPLLDNWGMLYVRPDSEIESILDLDGRSVAILETSTHGEHFRGLVEEFGIECTIIEAGSFAEVAEFLDRGDVDGGVLNRLIGHYLESIYDIRATSAVFNPLDVRMAASPETPSSVIEAIDAHLAELKDDRNSLYYQSFSEWLGEPESAVFPRWATWTLISGAGLVGVLVLASVILRSQVKAGTADLVAKNVALESEIAEHGRTQRALQESETRYRQVIRVAHGVAYEYDWISETYPFMEESIEELIGYTSDEMTPKLFRTIIIDNLNDTGADMPSIEKGRERTNFRRADLRLRKRDGSTVWVMDCAVRIRNAKGEIIRTIGMLQDIADRKQVEEEIRRSKILLESSIESPKDMIILSLDREYRYLYFNGTHAESMRHVYGTRPRIGDCIFDHMKDEDDIAKVKAHYDRATSGESHIAIEEYGEGQSHQYYEIRYNPIYDERSGIIGITSFAQNISERVRAEEAQQQLNAELDERVRERTAELRRMVNLMAGREVRMAELKDVIRELRTQLQEADMTPVAGSGL
jgi:PAS domain S-box-containing protein